MASPNVPANVPAAVTKPPHGRAKAQTPAAVAKAAEAQAPPVRPLTTCSPAPPASQSEVSEVPAKSAAAQGVTGARVAGEVLRTCRESVGRRETYWEVCSWLASRPC